MRTIAFKPVKRCERCNHLIPQSMTECPYCQGKLHIKDEEAPMPTPSFTMPQFSRKTWYIIAGVVAAIAVVAVLSSLLSSKGETADEEMVFEEEFFDEPEIQDVTMYGSVDKYPITMMLTIYDDNNVYGNYYYNKQGPDRTLQLSGTYDDGEMDVYEEDEYGNQTGHFHGTYSNGVFRGDFTTSNGKTMSFRVSE